MVPITHKSSTLRKAIAQAIVRVSKPETIQAIRNRTVPKGDVLECARVAGLFAAKRTADMIPDCHPLPIEFTAVRYELGELEIQIQVEIHTIYKTGVEVEAMHAASVVALTVYDMLKPLDKGVSIEQIKLIEKKGGKSDRNAALGQARRAAILVCSDSLAAGQGSDRSGEVIREKLVQLGIAVEEKQIVPDAVEAIQAAVTRFVAQGVDLLLVTGGTGLSPRDVTPEALEPLLDRRIPGVGGNSFLWAATLGYSHAFSICSGTDREDPGTCTAGISCGSSRRNGCSLPSLAACLFRLGRCSA